MRIGDVGGKMGGGVRLAGKAVGEVGVELEAAVGGLGAGFFNGSLFFMASRAKAMAAASWRARPESVIERTVDGAAVSYDFPQVPAVFDAHPTNSVHLAAGRPS